jgi:hypothetical protein
MKIKELTIEQFKTLIEDTIEAKLEEILGDPDEGLKLTDEAKAKIEESLAAAKRGEKSIPLEKVAEEMGIELE